MNAVCVGEVAVCSKETLVLLMV